MREPKEYFKQLNLQVNLPTKFVFLVLAPKHTDAPPNYYLDIGRSMAQLLTDKVRWVFSDLSKSLLIDSIQRFPKKNESRY